MPRSHTTGFVLGLLAALCWSPHFYVVSHSLRAAGDTTPVLVFYFHVVFWAAIACLALLVLLGRLDELAAFQRRETRFILLALTGGYGLWLLRALALERTSGDPSEAHILFYTGPLLLGLLSFPSREGARGRELAALVLGFVGCVLIAVPPSDSAQGRLFAHGLTPALLAVGSAACWAIFALMVRPVARDEKVLPISAILWSMGALCLLATCLSTGDNPLAITHRGLWMSMALGAGTVALGFACWMKCLSEMPAAAAAPLWYLALVFGMGWTWWRMGQTPGWYALAGVVLILLAARSGRTVRAEGQLSMSDLIRG